jgi:hypothetical protein
MYAADVLRNHGAIAALTLGLRQLYPDSHAIDSPSSLVYKLPTLHKAPASLPGV